MLDTQTRANGYTECNPPVLVNDAAMYGTDKLPKFAADSFRTMRVPPPDPSAAYSRSFGAYRDERCCRGLRGEH